VVTGVVSGASLGRWIAGGLDNIALLAPYAKGLGLALGVLVITLLSIVFGELIPKRMAMVAPERIASAVSRPLFWIGRIATPAVLLLSWMTNGVLRLFGLHRRPGETKVSEEEIQLLVAESHEQGVIDQVERSMVTRVLKFGDRTALSLMTPRNRIHWLDLTAPLEENLAVMRSTPYSRYPVMRGSDREVVGVLETKTLLDFLGKGQRVDLFRKLAKPLFVPDTMRAMDLLDQFRDAEVHLAFVVDEYGDLSGIVSLNDILSAVVGQNAQFSSEADAPIVQRSDGSYLIDGSLPVEDLGDLLLVGEFPEPDDRDYNTLAGLVMNQLGRVPKVGEIVQWRDWRIEVIDLDGARIDKLLVSRTPPATAAAAGE
jgi:putative hemolysin